MRWFNINILDLLYPNVCGFCGKIDANSLCLECEKNISQNLLFKIEDVSNKFFDKQMYIARYEGDFRKEILEYKFFDKAYMYKTFAKIILKNEKIYEILKSYDIIIAVPIHKKRKNQRGYNQSELIAKEIARNVQGLEYKKVLKKIKNNIEQSSLNRNERLENVKNVYEIQNKEIIFNKKVILFDDIYTTGNTVNECSRILKINGAKEILVFSLAR